jgi:hypothetical protein
VGHVQVTNHFRESKHLEMTTPTMYFYFKRAQSTEVKMINKKNICVVIIVLSPPIEVSIVIQGRNYVPSLFEMKSIVDQIY